MISKLLESSLQVVEVALCLIAKRTGRANQRCDIVFHVSCRIVLGHAENIGAARNRGRTLWLVAV